MIIVNLIAYSALIILAVILVLFILSSVRLAAREKEFVKQHADEWNEHVKRMQAKGRWNNVK
jgi:protein-S-isoprenylcysteine O-methyltransferase Ste14